MKHYTSYILATIMFLMGVASVQAQGLTATVSKASDQEKYAPVYYENSYHVVQDTRVKVTLSGAKVPESSEDKTYDDKLKYKKGDQLLQTLDGTDDFQVSGDAEVTYYAVATYQLLKKNEGTGEWENDGEPVSEAVDSVTIKFTGYNEPNITNLQITPDTVSTYKGAGNVSFSATFESPVGDNLKTVVSWKEDNNDPVEKPKDETFNFTPVSVGSHTISASVVVYAPDNKTIWNSSQEPAQSSINVLEDPTNVITSEILKSNISIPRRFSYVDQDVKYSFDVNITNIEGYNNYKWKYKWEFNNNSAEFSDKSKSQEFDNPIVANTYPVKLIVQAYNPNNDTESWGKVEYSTNDEESVIVLPAPVINVTGISLSPFNGVTYVNGHDVKITLSSSTNASEVKDYYREIIEWKIGEDGVYTENQTGDKNTYNFNPNNKEAGNFDVYYKVSIIGPDNNVWGKSEGDVTVNVLPNPTSVITPAILKSNISIPRRYSYAGQKIQYNFEVKEDIKDVEGYDNYKWKYKWEFNNKSTEFSDQPESPDFDNPEDANTYPVKLIVQAYNPDKENEGWGTPIEYTTNDTDNNNVHVLKKPSDAVNSGALLKRINRDSDTYSYVGKKDAKHQYTVSMDDLSDYYWKYTWSMVDSEGANPTNPEPDSDQNRTATFANPSTAGWYNVKLSIQACNPANHDEKWDELISCTTTPADQSIRIFNEPKVLGIKFGDDEDFNNTDTTYINGVTNLEVVCDNVDSDLKAIVSSWKLASVIDGSVSNVDGLTATYTAPENAKNNVTIRATVDFKVDKFTLKTTTATKVVNVLPLQLISKSDSYIDDDSLKIEIKGFENFKFPGFVSYWELYVNDDNICLGTSETSSMTYTFDKNFKIPNDQDYVKTKIIAKLMIRQKNNPDYTQHKSTLSKFINVYKTPSISKATSSLDSKYSVIDTVRVLTASVEHTPASLPIRVDWYKNNETEPFDSTIVKDNGKSSIEYIPVSEDVENLPKFYAKVYVCSPDEKERWATGTTNNVTLTVYQKPEDAVSETALKSKITENVGDNAGKPEMLVGYDGQPDLGFTYKVNALDGPYKWVYNWQLLDNEKKLIDGKEYNNVSEPIFSNLTTGTYYIRLVAEAYNPEDGVNEKWGKQETILPNPITIYSAPVYESMGYHKIKHDDEVNADKYSILTGETFDASKLYSIKDDNGNETGYPNGWNPTLTVSKDGNPVECNDITFTPSEKGTYTLTLKVTNDAPTGTWLDSKDTNGGNDYVYTLYVYDKPQWDVKNTTDLFDAPDDNRYVRHIVSGNNIPFKIIGKDGDESSDKWTLTMRINEDEPVPFTNESLNFTYDFSKTNTTVNKNTYDFNIHGTNNISYLSKDSRPDTLDIQGTIYVWKEIKATIASPGQTGEDYILETRVGDSAEQKIKINLVGGDPDKWILTSATVDGVPGVEDKNGYAYTYTMLDKDFNSAKTYNYTFTAQYKDGATDITAIDVQKVSVIVYPEPVITNQVLALANDGKNVKYTEQSGTYNVTCYNSDNLQLSLTPDGGKDNETWKYQEGTGSKQDVPNNGIITVDKSETITVFNYLGEKEKEVKKISAQITRLPDPKINNVLPDVDNTTGKWNTTTTTNRLDLYGDPEKPQFSEADFDFSPQTNNVGNENGWDYTWIVNGTEQSKNIGKWGYIAETSTDVASEDKTITVHIKNSIPAGNGQDGENVGFDETKSYYVRVWHKAELPSADYSLTDKNNSNNDVKTTHGIRKGNILKAHVNPVKFGYNPGNTGNNYQYSWDGQGSKNQNEWTKTMETGIDEDQMSFKAETYKLTVRNVGPRGTVWAEKTFEPCEVKVYNRPVTPTSLVIKGSGASGTLIITYDDIYDEELLTRADYAVNFFYTDNNGEPTTVSRLPAAKGERRWATTGIYNISETRMSDAYTYAHWLDEENGVLITSGKRTLSGQDENWDGSIYNLTDNEVREIQELTRAGSGDWTRINAADSGMVTDGDLQVYNMNGMMVGSSVKGLPAGMYIIRYQQDGVIKSKKLSVK